MKKRSKKLLLISGDTEFTGVRRRQWAKVFLVLFFKKEHLPSFATPRMARQCRKFHRQSVPAAPRKTDAQGSAPWPEPVVAPGPAPLPCPKRGLSWRNPTTRQQKRRSKGRSTERRRGGALFSSALWQVALCRSSYPRERRGARLRYGFRRNTVPPPPFDVVPYSAPFHTIIWLAGACPSAPPWN